MFDFSCPYTWNVALKNINILVHSGGQQVSGYELFICSPQLLLQMPDFHSLQLFLYPEFYTFSLSLLLSCPGDLARERTLSSVFFILFSFSLCQIGAGQFHPVHVSVTCLFTETRLCQGQDKSRALVLGFWCLLLLSLVLTVLKYCFFQRSEQCPGVCSYLLLPVCTTFTFCFYTPTHSDFCLCSSSAPH